MREHQIVITLKPEQFAEVQRLSKAAGAKSMGIFVRKTLLAALGLDGGKATGKQNSERIKHITEDLKRLHGEIKLLLSDSVTKDSLPGQTMIDSPRSPVSENEVPEAEEVEIDTIEEEETEHAIADLDELPVRDPLEDLLDRPLLQRLQAYLHSKDASKTADNPEASEEEEEVIELPAPVPEPPRTGTQTPPSGIPGKNSPPFSGGPPPKKPQN